MHDRKKLRNNQYIKYTYLIFDQQSSQIVFLLNNSSLFYKDYKVSQILHILFIRKKKYMKNKRTDTTSPSKWFSVHIFKMNKKKKIISWDYLCLSFTLWFGMSKTLETCILYVKRKLFKLEFGLDISHSTTHETL